MSTRRVQVGVVQSKCVAQSVETDLQEKNILNLAAWPWPLVERGYCTIFKLVYTHK